MVNAVVVVLSILRQEMFANNDRNLILVNDPGFAMGNLSWCNFVCLFFNDVLCVGVLLLTAQKLLL